MAVATRSDPGAPSPASDGIGRSWQILQAMRREQTDPRGTYTFLGADAAAMVDRYRPLDGATAIDVGGGPGYTAEAMRARGAHAFTVDPFAEELCLHGRTPVDAVVGDGLALPFPDGALDVVCTLNALEHVPTPWTFLDELVRVTRAGGIVFVGVTNWLSPWGGHETSPWHYLGGERAARRYRHRTGTEAKNRYGRSLFPVAVGDVLGWARGCERVRVLDAFPRYYPRWCRPLVRVPGVREVAIWNLGLVVEKR
ncbi:MAG: class I SAM-dependent methyltransferase [Acidimicrobiales bacterium]|nr:class I SAM-dependent methyltransferase [Acidimicrobiales bacterium]